MNPVAGAGVTLAAYMAAKHLADLESEAQQGKTQATISAIEAQAHMNARVENFSRYVAATQAIIDITGIGEQDAIALIDKYLKTDTVRWQRERALLRMLKHFAIQGVNRDIKGIGEGVDVEALIQTGREIRDALNRLGITPVHEPVAHEIAAGRKASQRAVDSARLAQEAEAEKERQDAAKAEAIRQDILKRQAESEAKWAKRMGFVKGLFGFGNRPAAADEKPAPNTNTSPGPRPE